jgi:hypothetical protein
VVDVDGGNWVVAGRSGRLVGATTYVLCLCLGRVGRGRLGRPRGGRMASGVWLARQAVCCVCDGPSNVARTDRSMASSRGLHDEGYRL